MNTVEIKQNFHDLIDKIDNERLLINFYDLMKKRSSAQEGKLWNRLSEDQQNELLRALDEIQHPANLIPHSDMKIKHSKWL
jgi:hypothetical protein